VGKRAQNLLSYAKEVVTLRKQNPALRRGDFKRLWSADGTYTFSRSLDGETLVIALNTSDSPQQVEVTYETKKPPKAVFGEASEIAVSDSRLKFKIPARCGVVLK
jgi:glycosidase